MITKIRLVNNNWVEFHFVDKRELRSFTSTLSPDTYISSDSLLNIRFSSREELKDLFEAIIAQNLSTPQHIVYGPSTPITTLEKYLEYLKSGSELPIPPELPDDVSKGFNSDGYWDLIHSLEQEERPKIIKELESPQIIERALTLKEKMADVTIFGELDSTRELFLAALLCLQKGEISKAQLATLHLVDSAIRTLYTSVYSYLCHASVINNELVRSFKIDHVPTNNNMPNRLQRYHFSKIVVPDENFKIENLPSRMRQPLVMRFFDFTETEWINFCKEMRAVPKTEQFAHVLVAPEHGCWSSIIFKIQDTLKCMQVLDWYMATKDGVVIEKIMVVPSFSMFQAAINVKAKTLKRSPITLVPTYDYVNDDLFTRYKASGFSPMAMYLPERDPLLRYNSSRGKFRTTVDGHPYETAFAGAIHDAYHAFRELQMTDKVSAARLRLAAIAKNHPNNQISPDHRAISTVLLDGELVFSYKISKCTLFKNENRPQHAESFGAIFYGGVKANLHDNLKREFIHDMVINKDEWFENFGIGKVDLLDDERVIYEELEQQEQVEHLTPMG